MGYGVRGLAGSRIIVQCAKLSAFRFRIMGTKCQIVTSWVYKLCIIVPSYLYVFVSTNEPEYSHLTLGCADIQSSFLLSPSCFLIMYRPLSNLLISSFSLSLSIWAACLLPALSLGAPTRPAKVATTQYNTHITRQAPPLPELPTANIDRSSLTVKGCGVLVHYISNNVDFATATQAVIVIHGRQRDAANYFAGMQAAVDAANKSKLVIMAVRVPFYIYLKIFKLINTYSPFSSMGRIRARFHGRMARLLPINSYGRVSMHSTYCTESII
jgi:hypothetical protein